MPLMIKIINFIQPDLTIFDIHRDHPTARHDTKPQLGDGENLRFGEAKQAAQAEHTESAAFIVQCEKKAHYWNSHMHLTAPLYIYWVFKFMPVPWLNLRCFNYQKKLDMDRKNCSDTETAF